MSPTDNGEAEVSQTKPELQESETPPSQEKAGNLFHRAKERFTGRRKNILNTFSEITQENPTVDLSSEKKALDDLTNESDKLDESTGVSLAANDESAPTVSGEADMDKYIAGERRRLKSLGAAATPEDWDAFYDAENAHKLSKENEENEKKEVSKAKYKVDDLAAGMMRLQQDGTVNQQTLRTPELDALDWMLEKPGRASEVDKYIKSQEALIDKALSLPGLNPAERGNLEKNSKAMEEVRRMLKKRGIDLSPRVNQPDTISVEVGPTGVPNDPEAIYEFAYHATPFRNMPSIAEVGLALSGEDSKEPGTIWFNDHNNATTYLGDRGILFRTRISNIPEFSHYMGNNGKPDFHGVDSTRTPISADSLEFTLDKGKTWRNDMSMFRGNNAD